MVDLLVIGGGINGAGIARDAAGRGLSVVLAERGDLGGATSSSSSKLIHGGLRYLEQYEFRLVGEALAEREILLRTAAHLVHPATFVMPHVPGLRPRWMIRAGLFLYDHLARRSLLPASRAIRLDAMPYGSGLKPGFRRGFCYADCSVDDARLVVCNAADAAARGARVLVRTECLSALPDGHGWRATLSSGEVLSARVIVNAAGPWVKEVLNERLGVSSTENVRLVKGSHIVVPRLYEGDHAFILQNDDRRVVFMIPFQTRFTLIGTTDVTISAPDRPVASPEEIEYLCRAVNRYVRNEVAPRQVLWSYSGVRPLHDDGSTDPSAITRDYVLQLDHAGGGDVLSVFGGKITTYRRLAEHALDKLKPHFPEMKGAWTAAEPLAGSRFSSSEEAKRKLLERYPRLPAEEVLEVFARHGALAAQVLGDGELGERYGGGLTEREVRYFVEREWASTAEDVLWRRSKAGLQMSERQRARVAQVLHG
ncbi:MAG TPA: glycerol-3-phosphate dehydrogenase [Burkholderiales bacterium]|jgi:glycerol-3-phosphate dehydrogenase|nr:glycerol-3-phosphate dehydrogenase [Burkholderiales bacterium]